MSLSSDAGAGASVIRHAESAEKTGTCHCDTTVGALLHLFAHGLAPDRGHGPGNTGAVVGIGERVVVSRVYVLLFRGTYGLE